jgi:hypothetical protein
MENGFKNFYSSGIKNDDFEFNSYGKVLENEYKSPNLSLIKRDNNV